MVKEDSISYVFGLIIIFLGEYLVLREPQLFTTFYIIILTILVIRRFFEYKSEKSLLFMLDLCYFVNISCLVQLIFFPNCQQWHLCNYALSLGSLMNAMVVWQNSFILHNLSKITSCLLHAFAPFTLHLVRWSIIPTLLQQTEVTIWDVFILPMLMYLLWQIVYLLITEIVLASWIKSDKDQVFALRALATDSNNGMHQLVLGIMRKIGVMKNSEEFDAETIKTKLIFVSAQLMYTIVTLLPVKLLYNSYIFSILYLTGIFAWCVFQGAESYFEDFTERYRVNNFSEKKTT